MNAPMPRPSILDIMPYKGGDGTLPGFENTIRLASNEGALGPSPKVIEVLNNSNLELHRYPDGGATMLREGIGKHFDHDPERIVCGAGSEQLISAICRAYAGPGDEVLISEHAFVWYSIVAKAVGATPVKAPEPNLYADVDALLSCVTGKTKILFLANPNNPTGTAIGACELKRLHAGLRDNILLVVDSAYAEFIEWTEYSTGADLVDAARNVIMTRTFSKLYALSALRIGWAYGTPEMIDTINRVRSPFNVNSAAQVAGLTALEDKEHNEKTRAHTTRWRTCLTHVMRELGYEVPDSLGNFILVRFPVEPGKTAQDADQYLRDKGIITRAQGSVGLPDCLRISIGTEPEMRAIMDAMEAFVG